ncbi:TPA: aldose 1-epimerase family protein [Serratia odorifera]|nr:aldose 1-epimerase family protein [Serratia odorifera]HEI8869129.1 aldose 1-epimerase family protein [Serratia odorifera]
MKAKIHLFPELFGSAPREIYRCASFCVTAFRYPSGIAGLTLANGRGHLTVLPYYGQMIWDAQFDGHDLKMEQMFSQPRPGDNIVDTYGCFAFHSGLLSNGCPSPDDSHPLHGEMPCAVMDAAWLELEGDRLAVSGSVEYVKGFGHRYRAQPAVRLTAGSAQFDIEMQVTNLAGVPMPLQYMCHMNYTYVAGATFRQNLPGSVLQLRESIPAHVKPTPSWLAFTQRLAERGHGICELSEPQHYDPEIVFFADRLSQYVDQAEFFMLAPQGHRFVTRFSTAQFNYATRWILHNADQKVAAFVLPATCRPEGYLAAERAGSLLMLAAGESRAFCVTTGVV